MAKQPTYKIPEGIYSLDFIRGLAIVAHTGAMGHSDIQALLDSDVSHKEKVEILLEKVKKVHNDN